MNEVIAFYAELGIDVPDRGNGWVDLRCFNPAHDDDRPSCGVNLEHGGFRWPRLRHEGVRIRRCGAAR